MIFIALGLLFVKHWIADFVIQSDWQVSQKGIYGAWGGIIHSGIHGLMTTIILCFFLPYIYGAILIGVFDALVHYHTDFVKARFGEKDPSNPRFWIHLGLDQLIHALFYIWLVWILQDIFIASIN